jgi:hypothetical protein
VGVVVIDTPAASSTEPHRGDSSLSCKFRLPRRCEIEIGQERGIWVS